VRTAVAPSGRKWRVRIRWAGRVEPSRAYLKRYEPLDPTWNRDSTGINWASLSLALHLGVIGWLGAHAVRLLTLPATFTLRLAGLLFVEVEARDDHGTVRRWHARGVRAAAGLERHIATRLEAGLSLPQFDP